MYSLTEPATLFILREPEEKAVKVRKFIDLGTDFSFKKIFGTEPNKEMLIDLLNQLFNGEKKIIDLTYQNAEQLGSMPKSRSALFDIRCTGSDGEEFIVEMQRANQSNFLKRILFYTSRLISQLGKRGRQWNFDLPEIYFIGILDFDLQDENPDKYRHHYKLRDDDSEHTVLMEGYGVILLELPKFKLELEALKTGLEKWCYLFKNLNSLDQIPLPLNEGIFKRFFSIAQVSNLSKKEYTMYQNSLLAKQTEYAVLKYAEKKGRDEEVEKIIKNLLAHKEFSISQISNITGRDEEFIQKIRESTG